MNKNLDIIAKNKDQTENSSIQKIKKENSLLNINFPEVIGSSLAIKQVLKDVLKISSSDSSVLIAGESGTGKELIASAIHNLSKRSEKCFVAINCSAIPEQLLEAELFGHEKGAFTGADKKRIGHLGKANEGSLFLDEIGDMPLRLQAKILRVIQEKKYSMLGSSEIKTANIRFIAATNKNLQEAIKSNLFRLDLYYRINVFNINLPPLRKRSDDIIDLIKHHLKKVLRENSNITKTCFFDDSAIEFLKKYPWPGNIRQLNNIIERLAVIKEGENISAEDVAQNFLPNDQIEKQNKESYLNLLNIPLNGINLPTFIENIENNLIKKALIKTGNNKNKAALLLGLNRTTLVEKIKKRKISH